MGPSLSADDGEFVLTKTSEPIVAELRFCSIADKISKLL